MLFLLNTPIEEVVKIPNPDNINIVHHIYFKVGSKINKEAFIVTILVDNIVWSLIISFDKFIKLAWPFLPDKFAVKFS